MPICLCKFVSNPGLESTLVLDEYVSFKMHIKLVFGVYLIQQLIKELIVVSSDASVD